MGIRYDEHKAHPEDASGANVGLFSTHMTLFPTLNPTPNNTLEQMCSTELSVVMKILYIYAVQYSSH